MPLRFRKSVSMLPGVRLNFGSKGFTSVRIGGRSGGTTIGKTGVRSTISAPGTGLSYSTHTPWKAKPRRRPVAPKQEQLEDNPIATIRHTQSMAQERLAKIEAFERQIAEGAETDYKAACHELLEYSKAISTGYMELCDSTIRLIEASQSALDQQQSLPAAESRGKRLAIAFAVVAIAIVLVAIAR